MRQRLHASDLAVREAEQKRSALWIEHLSMQQNLLEASASVPLPKTVRHKCCLCLCPFCQTLHHSTIVRFASMCVCVCMGVSVFVYVCFYVVCASACVSPSPPFTLPFLVRCCLFRNFNISGVVSLFDFIMSAVMQQQQGAQKEQQLLGLYSGDLYFGQLFTSIVFTRILFTRILFASILFTSILFKIILFTRHR